jgi:hypothetical protein
MKDKNNIYEENWELAYDYYYNNSKIPNWITKIKYKIKRFIRKIFKNEDIPF